MTDVKIILDQIEYEVASGRKSAGETFTEMRQLIDAQRDACARMRDFEAALKFYSDQETYAFKKKQAGPMGACGIEYQDIMVDRGAYATSVLIGSGAQTPGAIWRKTGKPDPHRDRYDCERAQLMGGDMTDDEVANDVFMKWPSGQALIVPAMVAKDRIRWLSRSLEKEIERANRLEKAATTPNLTSDDCPNK